MGMFRSKVAGVFGAAVLLGVVAGTLAAFTAIHPLSGPFGSAAALVASDAATATASAGSATSSSSSPTGGSASSGASASPTSTIPAVPTATRAPRPTATVLPPGQGTLNNGRVVSISPSTSSFVLSVSGLHYTCHVDGSTTWTGAANGIGTTNPLRVGMIATVTGTMQTYPDFTATLVTSQPGDN